MDAVVEEGEAGAATVALPALHASVTLRPGSTSISTRDNEPLRQQLRDIVLRHLAVL